MEYPFVNEGAPEPEVQVWCVPIFRKNELWAFFEVPALAYALDRYADRGLGHGMMFVQPQATTHVDTDITPLEASPMKPNRRRTKEKQSDRTQDSPGETSRSTGEDPKLPEVSPRRRKKKSGPG